MVQKHRRKVWVEVIPVSVSAGMDPLRPVMIFKEKVGSETLPVWLSPLDAGIAVTQEHVKTNASSPHDLARKVFEKLNLKVQKCFFLEIKGHHQIVEVHWASKDGCEKISTRADQAISFCMREGAQFYATKEFMASCRAQDAQMLGFSAHLKTHPEVGINRHPYLN